MERVATFLIRQGVGPGHRIGLLAPNATAYLPAAFGLLATGACLVPIAANHTPAEIAQILRDVEVNGCLTWPGAEVGPASAARATLAGGECDGFTFEWIARDLAGPDALRRLNPAFIRFTSGTTAVRKGVVLSHEATAARVDAADRVLRFTDEDRMLWVLPLAYHFAVTIVAYVRAGAHILLCSDTFPGRIVEAIRRLRATVFYASPLHFERMGNLAPTGPLASLRLALSTSAPIAPAAMERFTSRYAVRVGQAYGIIEAGLPCINPGSDDVPIGSVGRVVPGYEIATFSDDGERRPAGTAGEIGVRGDGLFSAYYTPWVLREQRLTGRVVPHGGHRAAGRPRDAVPARAHQDGDLRGRTQVLPRRGRDVHQRVPRRHGVSRVRDPARAAGSGAPGRGRRRLAPPATSTRSGPTAPARCRRTRCRWSSRSWRRSPRTPGGKILRHAASSAIPAERS